MPRTPSSVPAPSFAGRSFMKQHPSSLPTTILVEIQPLLRKTSRSHVV
ncbi:UNVERIFIED_CONTAM: hypothetical protein GTU68_053362 [Idotea baltica]|nr:hypothetical protein [Idotea baltica]